MKRAFFTLIAVAVLAVLSATASLGAVVQTSAASTLANAVTFRTGSLQTAMLPGTSTLASYDLSIALVVIALAFTATLAVALVTRRT